ncbi:hypothetical protein PR202_ga00456 [Eleusine coracana subsp. coracana]|uniref:Uncharacterized protein n=1 Tax=Eleusine coracana subsp. coracana TaxID=191504 RepID=A0AAV5BGB5_ELECO|nr:hypothetical protein PR202_ga00456 [Eleusine coracana subsp. coracana]
MHMTRHDARFSRHETPRLRVLSALLVGTSVPDLSIREGLAFATSTSRMIVC